MKKRSKKTQWYKIYTRYLENWEKPSQLTTCEYVNGCIKSMALTILCTMMATAFLATLYNIALFHGWESYKYFIDPLSSYIELFAGLELNVFSVVFIFWSILVGLQHLLLCFVFWIVVIIGVLVGVGKIRKRSKEPNVIVEYVKAKHEKICPLIEFED